MMSLNIKTKLYKNSNYKAFTKLTILGFDYSLINPKSLLSPTLVNDLKWIKKYTFYTYHLNAPREEKLGYLLESVIGIRILIKSIEKKV